MRAKVRRRRVAVFQTRTVTRPFHNQFSKSLRLKRDHWEQSGASYFVACHGKGPMDKDIYEIADAPDEIFDWRDQTDGTIVDLTRRIFEFAFKHKYEFVCLLDDDGYFTYPDEAMSSFVECMDRFEKVGVCGPMRMFFNKTDDLFTLMNKRPWTTFGSQFFRIKALKECHYEKAFHVRFRHDCPLFMSIFMAGWNCYEVRVKFDHTCSQGITHELTAEHLQNRLRHDNNDWKLTMELVKNYPKLVADCEKLWKSTERKFKKMIDQLS